MRDLLFPRRRFMPRLTVGSLVCVIGGICVGCLLTLHHVRDQDLKGDTTGLFLRSHSMEDYLLLSLLILTAPRNFKVRDTLRNTWLKLNPSVASSSSPSIRHFFIVGTSGLQEKMMSKLTAEQELNEDMLFLPDLVDSFENLTTKVGHALRSLATSYPSHYVLKCDDDSFVRIDEIAQELEERQRELARGRDPSSHQCYQWGFFDGRAPVLRRGKWKESDYNLCDYYIPYALGGGYVMNKACVDFINRNLKNLKKFKNEDVAVGTWLSVLGPTRRHDVRFDTQYDSRGCSNKYLVQHKLTLVQMTERYNNLVVHGRLCSKEIKKRSSWDYNWDVHPSRCCQLNESII